MTNLIRTVVVPLFVALASGVLGTGIAAAACLDNRQIQESVASGEIMSLAAVLSSAGIDNDSEVLSVQVCDQGGRLVYVIGVLTPGGEASTVEVNAQ